MRILFICHRVPYPPDKGDRIRSYHLLRCLTTHGDVDVVFLAEREVPRSVIESLETICRGVRCYPVGSKRRWGRAALGFSLGKSATEGLFWSSKLARDCGEWLGNGDYDAVVCFSSSMLPYVVGKGADDRVIVDLVDVDSQKWIDYARHAPVTMKWLYRTEGKRVRRLEYLATKTRAVILATEPEAGLFRTAVPGGRAQTVSNGVDLDFFQPSDEYSCDKCTCVFVGYLDYHANVTGLEWFCKQVWPDVVTRFPQAEFRIVGRRAVPRVRSLATLPGVNLVGEVEDIRSYLHSAAVVIAPLLVARGVQNKVLEAMACGKAVVGSSPTLDGLNVQPGRDVMRADSISEWISALEWLWTDDGERQKMGSHARLYVERNHSWETCLGTFKELVMEAERGLL